ncbi:MAG: AraC family transcriptional regulator ligand-binding domain-containing protein, partial [Caulobacterales bacterium]
MTAYVANTVRRYVAQLTELGHGAPVLEKFDRLAITAISKHGDLPATELLRLFDYIADKGPADIALRCGGARRLAELGVVGHAIASCPTLRAALEIAIAHGAAGDKSRQVHYQMRGEDWMVDIRAAPALRAGVRRLICEEWIATLFAHLAEVTQITRPQVRIELNYAPAPGVDYARWLP